MLDSEALFYAATQNASVDPCVDFKEFSVGTFIKDRAINDRYRGVGWWFDFKDHIKEKYRKLLSTKIDSKKDMRVIKVMKNYFQKCVNSSIGLKIGKISRSDKLFKLFVLFCRKHK